SSELAEEERDSLRQAFNRIADELTKIEGLELIPMKIEFRKSESIGANAFALPSGTIIFTDEMVKLAENQEQLETIMLHEIGHIAHRHSLRRLIQQSSLALFIVIVTGDISTTSQAILALPGVLLQAGYSQKMELEADDFALKHLQEFGLHPEDFITLMENLESQEKDQGANEPEENIGSVEPKQESEIQGYFSSHPSTSERLERFRNHRH
ncbi:M48 family metallopeptidase, partial [Oleiphilus sp. HI0123]